MIYTNNYYEDFNSSVFGDVKNAVTHGTQAVTDFFFIKESPCRSLSTCLTKVRLDPDLQKVKGNWQKMSSDSSRKAELKKIGTEYEKQMKKHGSLVDIQYNQLFGGLGLNAGVSGLWMPGVAMIATHLKEKKGLDGLFVCAHRKALCAKIEEIIANPKDQRCALITGTSNDDKDFPLHKMAICIEKKDGRLQIAVLDSYGNDCFSSNIIHEIVKICEKTGCKDPEIFLSIAKREAAGYGCGVFALQDAVSFLQDAQFFQNLDFSWTNIYGNRQIEINTILPPGFMIGAQSMRGVEEYRKNEGQKVFDQPILGRKKTLQAYLKRNVLVIDGKRQNHYITKKTLQYQQFITSALKELKTEEVKGMIHATLLT